MKRAGTGAWAGTGACPNSAGRTWSSSSTGCPLAIIELKNPTDEEASIWTAFQQLQTYKAELPTLFAFKQLLGISDGLEGHNRQEG